ncbi:MAG: hypothetical protein RIS29_2952 [Bacteroidota bacterium]
MSQFRQLTEMEIAKLAVYGCSAVNWKSIKVAEDFSADFFQNVHFSGDIQLGTYHKLFDLPGGLQKHAGIFNVVLHNCSIGNDVYINTVKNYMANMRIDDGAYIENVDAIYTEGESSFGNGTQVAAMIESGGREVTIFDRMSAPLAYLQAFYRHDAELQAALAGQIGAYVHMKTSATGRIGQGVRIINSGTLKNMFIGDFAQMEGVTRLENGTLESNQQAPVIVGTGVQCNDFIVQSGTSVTDAAMLTRCFVGQGCQIGKQFSAIDSVFFANCQGLHGEAISIFAGPYTVTHHKSTLMLTALYSFMNAGSGTNFSNHMYKLGPVHQGVTERGVKTSSGSYIMWPARIGAFSVVLGKHKGNPDISNLPFSYLMENDGESHLLPGINLHSAGTIRDVQKWPKRDLRKGFKIDPICFDFLSPYTISKALKGAEILRELQQNMDAAAAFVWYQNCKLKKAAIRKGIELYEMAADSFVAKVFAEQGFNSEENAGAGDWVDMVGLLAPKAEVDALCAKIVADNLFLDEVLDELQKIYRAYDSYCLGFANAVVSQKYGKTVAELTDEEKAAILEKGRKADAAFNDLILRDAKKEFSSVAKTGFGIDGDEEVRNADFAATRGTFDEHPFVVERKSN